MPGCNIIQLACDLLASYLERVLFVVSNLVCCSHFVAVDVHAGFRWLTTEGRFRTVEFRWLGRRAERFTFMAEVMPETRLRTLVGSSLGKSTT